MELKISEMHGERETYRQMVIYGGMQRISSFTIRFLGWKIRFLQYAILELQKVSTIRRFIEAEIYGNTQVYHIQNSGIKSRFLKASSVPLYFACILYIIMLS